MWYFNLSIFFTVALACIGIAGFITFISVIRDYVSVNQHTRTKGFFTPARVMFAGVLLSSIAIFFPLFMAKMNELHIQEFVGPDYVEVMKCVEHDHCWVCHGREVSHVLKAICMAIHQAIRLFAIDGEYSLAAEMYASPLIVPGFSACFYRAYLPTIALLCVLAPILTFTFVLTFFRTLWLSIRYRLAFFRSIHIFSDLNERTIALANSIVEKSKKDGKGFVHYLKRPLIIFTDVLKKQEEEHFDLIHSAKLIHAFCFDKDLTSIRFKKRKGRKLRFYIISENEDENMKHLVDIRRHYNTKSTELYMFSDKIQSQLILGVKKDINMKIYRIYDKQALIYQNLERFGMRLFERAHRIYDMNEEAVLRMSQPSSEYDPESLSYRDTGKISVVLVGFGQYGVEMLKALIWFCQMAGYCLDVTVFDKEKNIEDKARRLIPYAFQKGEMTGIDHLEQETDLKLTMRFFGEVDVFGYDFEKKLSGLPETTYVFVGLGDDETNIEVSTAIRNVFEKMRLSYIEKLQKTYEKTEGLHLGNLYENLPADIFRPDIEAIVYDSNISRILSVTWPIPGVLSTAENMLRDTGLSLLKQKNFLSRAADEDVEGCILTFIADVEGFWNRLVTKEWDADPKKSYSFIRKEYLSLDYALIPRSRGKKKGKNRAEEDEPRQDWQYKLSLEENGTTVKFELTVLAPLGGKADQWKQITADVLWDKLVIDLPAAVKAQKNRYWNNDTCDGVKNHKGQPYRIHLTGDLDSYYSYDTVINSTLIKSGQVINERYNICSYLKNKETLAIYGKVEEYLASDAISEIRDQDTIHIFAYDDDADQPRHVADCVFSDWKDQKALRSSISADATKSLDLHIKKLEEANTGKTGGGDTKRRVILYLHRNIMSKNEEITVWDYPFADQDKLKEKISGFEETRAGKNFEDLRLDIEKNEYDYFSSIAKALHERLRLKMYYAGFFYEKDGVTLRPMLYRKGDSAWTQEEIEILLKGLITYWTKRDARHTHMIGRLEHPRWNAYMISEGYTRGVTRDFLAKCHHNIVPTQDLRETDIRKDA